LQRLKPNDAPTQRRTLPASPRLPERPHHPRKNLRKPRHIDCSERISRSRLTLTPLAATYKQFVRARPFRTLSLRFIRAIRVIRGQLSALSAGPQPQSPPPAVPKNFRNSARN